MRDETGGADGVDAHALDRRRRGRRAAPPWWRPASAQFASAARAAAMIAAVRRAVPLGASSLLGWCISTISTESKKPGRPGGELHHQHRADGEVRRDDDAEVGLVRQPAHGSARTAPR